MPNYDDPKLIAHETEIVWTEDIERFDYVREYLDQCAGTRRRPVRWDRRGRLVGYAVLAADAPNNGNPGYFNRRVFWVSEDDRSERPDGKYEVGAPAEAVDPRTVAPGVWGQMTERASGGPLNQGE